MKSALITGGAGFVGTHLMRELTERGVSCTSLDIRDPERPIAEGVRYLCSDVRQPLNVDGDFDTMFNLAAVHRTPGHPEGEYFETNVAGALNITKFAREQNISTILFTSSISTYGPSEDMKTEESELQPVSAYGKSKALAERIHRDWKAERDDHRLIVVRPAVTFGVGEHGNFDRLLNAMRQRRFVYPGRKDTIKSCGYVGDLVGSMLWALERDERDLTYNFCYPERTTIEQVATTIAEVFNVPPPPAMFPFGLMKVAAKPFDALDAVGIKTGINTPRIMKLVESTNVYPGVLERLGYPYQTTLWTGVQEWARTCAGLNGTVGDESEQSFSL